MDVAITQPRWRFHKEELVFGHVELEVCPSGMSGGHMGMLFRGLSQSAGEKPNSTSVGVEIIPQVDGLPRPELLAEDRPWGGQHLFLPVKKSPSFIVPVVCIAAVHIY